MGFFGQATKLVTSMLGGSGNGNTKKTKAEPVKSIQRAAAAAKKARSDNLLINAVVSDLARISAPGRTGEEDGEDEGDGSAPPGSGSA